MNYFIVINVSKDLFHYCFVNCQTTNIAHSNLTMDETGFNALKTMVVNYKDSVIA